MYIFLHVLVHTYGKICMWIVLCLLATKSSSSAVQPVEYVAPVNPCRSVDRLCPTTCSVMQMKGQFTCNFCVCLNKDSYMTWPTLHPSITPSTTPIAQHPGNIIVNNIEYTSISDPCDVAQDGMCPVVCGTSPGITVNGTTCRHCACQGVVWTTTQSSPYSPATKTVNFSISDPCDPANDRVCPVRCNAVHSIMANGSFCRRCQCSPDSGLLPLIGKRGAERCDTFYENHCPLTCLYGLQENIYLHCPICRCRESPESGQHNSGSDVLNMNLHPPVQIDSYLSPTSLSTTLRAVNTPAVSVHWSTDVSLHTVTCRSNKTVCDSRCYAKIFDHISQSYMCCNCPDNHDAITSSPYWTTNSPPTHPIIKTTTFSQPVKSKTTETTTLPSTSVSSASNNTKATSLNGTKDVNYANRTVCYFCSSIVCQSEEIVQCEEGNNFCLNSITQYEDGSRTILRGCTMKDLCFTKWWLETSDKTTCLSMSNDIRGPTHHVGTCHFCCQGSRCNMQARIPNENLYDGRTYSLP
ncbi:hypothetical protein CHS0354_008439 [Potamilus streckersoni]|uniref:Uncharacterized protein n=1 Tax=Potamilus streckersoni TaxID=2493646 RepID=A0AAE0RPI2_9BIVA|nr:hypothetical protein CHS0354_008439 [Potamilus streckersoni]